MNASVLLKHKWPVFVCAYELLYSNNITIKDKSSHAIKNSKIKI